MQLSLLDLDIHFDNTLRSSQEVAIRGADKGAKFIAVGGGGCAELVFQLANNGKRMLEGIFPILQRGGIRRLIRHGVEGIL